MLSWQPSPHRLHACKLLLRCKSSLNKASLLENGMSPFKGDGGVSENFIFSVFSVPFEELNSLFGLIC